MPLTVDEIRPAEKRYLDFAKDEDSKVAQNGHLDWYSKPEELLDWRLFADIANKSFPRLRADEKICSNTEREMNSIEAHMEEYNTVYGEEIGKARQRRCCYSKGQRRRKMAHLRVRRFIEELTLQQQRVEAPRLAYWDGNDKYWADLPGDACKHL